jgi:hypothetical protein
MTDHKYIRNNSSNLLINTDKKALEEYKEKRLLMQRIVKLEQKIKELEDRLNVITKIPEC